MKMKKRRFEQFLFYDYTGIEAHLEKMALKGWQLHKISPLCWTYTRIEPQKLTYTVTYFSEASDFNPYPPENQQTFHEYCQRAGWQLVAEWAQMQIFCTELENPVPIETDQSVKLRAIHRAMKKNYLPSSIVLILLSLLQILLQLHTMKTDPLFFLSNGILLSSLAVWVLLGGGILMNLAGYGLWYKKSVQAVNLGEILITSSNGYKKASHFLLFLTGIIAVYILFSTLLQPLGMVGFWGILHVAAVFFPVLAVKNGLKRAKVSRRVNLTITVLSAVLVSSVMVGALIWFLFSGLNSGWVGRQPAETYTTVQPNGSTWTWDIYHDPLPLRVEDLQEVAYDHYSYEWSKKDSFLLSHATARQHSFPDGQHAPELKYEMVEVKFPALFKLCLDHYLNQYNDKWTIPEEDKLFFQRTDDPLWQADEVYQLYRQHEAQDEYILCWGNRIVQITFDELPTPEQIAVAVEKLKK